MNRRRKKGIRKLYAKSKEALSFFKQYPEFNNFESNQVTSFNYYLNKLDKKRKEEAEIILQTLLAYPNEHTVELLTRYYEGQSFTQIKAEMGLKQKYMRDVIRMAKKAVLAFAANGCRVEMRGRKKYCELLLQHKGRVARVFKVRFQSNMLWVSEGGVILPEDVQDYLDGGPEITGEISDYLT